MRTWKRIAATSLATVLLLTLLSMSVFATQVPSPLMVEDGTYVTPYNPDVTVSVTGRFDGTALERLSSTTYIQRAQAEQYAPCAAFFVAPDSGHIALALTIFDGGPHYNMALVKQAGAEPSQSDPIVTLLEGGGKYVLYHLEGLEAGQSYYLRFSTYGTPGMAGYTVKF